MSNLALYDVFEFDETCVWNLNFFLKKKKDRKGTAHTMPSPLPVQQGELNVSKDLTRRRLSIHSSHVPAERERQTVKMADPLIGEVNYMYLICEKKVNK